MGPPELTDGPEPRPPARSPRAPQRAPAGGGGPRAARCARSHRADPPHLAGGDDRRHCAVMRSRGRGCSSTDSAPAGARLLPHRISPSVDETDKPWCVRCLRSWPREIGHAGSATNTFGRQPARHQGSNAVSPAPVTRLTTRGTAKVTEAARAAAVPLDRLGPRVRREGEGAPVDRQIRRARRRSRWARWPPRGRCGCPAMLAVRADR